MCQKGCEGCDLIRYLKPNQGNISFCVDVHEALTVDENIRKTNRFVKHTETHREKVVDCDHTEFFTPKTV